ncbi:hypothetical protein SDC9_152283 [bioreactor metagenome]|uniref:Uncharacterized protein n=1 Tax=bioreactor metagenome TaxID=1076179 RepID=A0A645EX61_9ZZZZ
MKGDILTVEGKRSRLFSLFDQCLQFFVMFVKRQEIHLMQILDQHLRLEHFSQREKVQNVLHRQRFDQCLFAWIHQHQVLILKQ